jgi:dolichol-phosphate mannosyltransferase
METAAHDRVRLRSLRRVQPRVWVTLPTFNEAGNIERVVRSVLDELERLAPDDHGVLIVDDASPDGTGEIAERLAHELPAVKVLHRSGKQGLGHAYLAGFEGALAEGAELVVVMDADYSHDPAHLPALLAAAEEYDLVLGSRYIPGGSIVDWPRLRRLLSRAGSLYARTILGVRIRDLTGGYRCIRREVLERVELTTLRSQGYVFNIELTFRALRAGFRVREVPIHFRDRTVGESKISLGIAIEALWLVPVLRFPGLARVWPSRSSPIEDEPVAATRLSEGSEGPELSPNGEPAPLGPGRRPALSQPSAPK